MNSLYGRLALALPGLWIDHTDRNYAWTAQHLMDMAVDQYVEAVVACSLFKPLSIEEFQRGSNCTDDESRAYESTLRFLYAKAYIYALDATRAFVAIISRQSAKPSETVKACNEFLETFGFIRDIRNSLQHIEERAQGIAKRKQIETPILNLGVFEGERRFSITSENGQMVGIEVAEEFLVRVQSGLEKIIWSFDWLGPGEFPIQRPENRASD